MPYGTIKIDTITFTDAGVDKSIAVSGLVQNPTFTGNVTVTGTVSGTTVRATTVSGVTVSGTTANFASGVFTTQISGAIHVAPAGTAGAPTVQVGTGASIAPGLYSPATDQLGISTGGSFRLVIDSTGRVGIGTSSPGAILHTTATSAGAATIGAYLQNSSLTAGTEVRLAFAPNTNLVSDNRYSWIGALNVAGSNDSALTFATAPGSAPGVERMRIDSSGNVGIGTASPLTKLDVRNGVITAGSANATSGSEILRGFYSDTQGAFAVIGSEYSSGGLVMGTGVKPSTSAPDAFLSSTSVALARGAYTIAANVHKWYIGASQTVAENSAVSTSEVMRIDSSGRVGIGTSSPSGGLHLGNPTAGSAADFVISNSANNWSIKTGTTTNAFTIVDNQFSAERLRIDSSGRVGIGTSSPQTKLDIATTGTYGVIYQPAITLRNTSGGGIVTNPTGLGAISWNVDGLYDVANIEAVREAPVSGTLSSLVFRTNGTNVSTGAGTERMKITSAGNVLINTLNDSGKFCVSAPIPSQIGQRVALFSGTATGDVSMECVGMSKFDNNSTTSQIFQRFYINNGATGCGQINANGAGTAAFGSYSDSKLKENIVNLPSQLQNIRNLRPVEFDYKDGSGHQIGFIAQEMQSVYADAVAEGPDEILMVTGWSKTEARLVKALQEAIDRIETLEAKVAALESA